MRHVVRLATIAAASLALAVGGASAAAAESDTVKDKRSDVVLNGKAGGDRTPIQESLARRRDVTGLRVSHGAKYVSVRLDFVKLERVRPERGNQQATIEIARKTVTNRTGTVTPSFEVRQDIGVPGSQPTIFQDGAERPCGVAVRSTLKYLQKGYYKLQIPRECLGNESKIKVRATVSGRRTFERTDAFRDPVSPTKFKTPAWTDWLLKG